MKIKLRCMHDHRSHRNYSLKDRHMHDHRSHENYSLKDHEQIEVLLIKKIDWKKHFLVKSFMPNQNDQIIRIVNLPNIFFPKFVNSSLNSFKHKIYQ